MRSKLRLALAVPLVTLVPACSVQRFSVRWLASGFADGSSSFADDPDPELVREALPFALKLMESLLAKDPENEDLLLACCSGFTKYAYGFLQQDADAIEPTDLARAEALRTRARGLYLRARDYGLRGLELRHPGITAGLRADAAPALAEAELDDVGLLYWSGAAWGSAIGLSADQPELVADLPIVHALFERALELDETFERGAIHTAWITIQPSRLDLPGDALARAEAHFLRAVELSHGALPGPYVSYAEIVCVRRQDAAAFRASLERALAIDPAAIPEETTSTLILQARARRLLAQIDELILVEPPPEESTP